MKQFNLEPIEELAKTKYSDMRGYVEIDFHGGCFSGLDLRDKADLNKDKYELVMLKFRVAGENLCCTLFVVDKEKYPNALESYDKLDVIKKDIEPIPFDDIPNYITFFVGITMIPASQRLNINIVDNED